MGFERHFRRRHLAKDARDDGVLQRDRTLVVGDTPWDVIAATRFADAQWM